MLRQIVGWIPRPTRMALAQAYRRLPRWMTRPVRSVLHRNGAGQGSDSVYVIPDGILEGYRLQLDLIKTEPWVASYWLGTHEPEVQTILPQIVRPGMVVYDIGSHIEYFALMFSHLAGHDGRVFAFEPDDANLARVRRNIDLNDVENIIPVHAALPDRCGTAWLVHGGFSGAHRVGEKQGQPSPSGAEVAILTVDSFAKGEPRRFPHLLKIDVEGAEGKVLLGARDVLHEHRPLVVCEIHKRSSGEETGAVLRSCGYVVYEITSEGLVAAGERFGGHILACHRSKTLPRRQS